MRRSIIAWLMVVLFGLVVLSAGCIGGRSAKPDAQVPEKSSSVEPTDVPDWFTNLPKNPEYMYAATTASARDLQNAFDIAKQAGMVDISSQISTKVSGMLKRFSEEVGMGEDAELRAQTTAVSRSLVDEVISGCRTAKQARTMESGKHRVYVLMEMPVQLANTALVTKIKGDKDMYTQFRASQAFKDLETEVEKREKEQS